MKQAVFPQKRVVALLKHFIPVIVNVDKGELPKGFECHMTPTFYIVEKGRLVDTVMGGGDAGAFIDYFKKFVK